MKICFTFLFFFAFLCFQAQKKDTAYCKMLYEAEKRNYEKELERINEINFDKLFDKILEEKEFKEYFSDNTKKVVFLNLTLRRHGYFDQFDNCPHFKKNIDEEGIPKKIWNKTNFNKFQKKIGNRIIIPVSLTADREGIIFGELDKQNNYFSRNKIYPFYKGKLIDGLRTRDFYYYSNLKPKQELIIKNDNLKIFDVDYMSFTVAVAEDRKEKQYIYITQLQVNDEKNNIKSSNAKFYKYENGEWVFLEENK